MPVVYLDSSTMLLVLLGEPGPLVGWSQWDATISSEILGVECRRALDRARLEYRVPSDALTRSLARLSEIEGERQFIRLSEVILGRASLPLPTIVKTLDALHLASAAVVRDTLLPDLVFATHDRQQAVAAEAIGFDVVGA